MVPAAAIVVERKGAGGKGAGFTGGACLRLTPGRGCSTLFVPRVGPATTRTIAERVVPALQRVRGSRVVAVASRDGGRAAAFAERFGIPSSFDRYEALLAPGVVDLLYLPLPNSLHAEWTLRAVEAGLHVLCEKPLAANGAEAERMAAAAQARGVVLAEAYMYRHHPQYSKLQELLAAGAIGALVSLQAEFSFLLDEPDSIVTSPALAEPVRVAAQARIDGVDRVTTGLLEFPGGVLATFTASIASAERHRAEVHGELGTIVLEDPWVAGEAGATLRIERHGEPAEELFVAGADSYRLQAQDFVDAVCEGRPPRWPAEDGVANMRVLDGLRGCWDL